MSSKCPSTKTSSAVRFIIKNKKQIPTSTLLKFSNEKIPLISQKLIKKLKFTKKLDQ